MTLLNPGSFKILQIDKPCRRRHGRRNDVGLAHERQHAIECWQFQLALARQNIFIRLGVGTKNQPRGVVGSFQRFLDQISDLVVILGIVSASL